MPKTLIAAASAALVLAAAAEAQAQPPQAAPARISAETAMGSGPYAAVMRSEAGLATHTVYRPAAFPDGKLPVVVWGNGGCRNAGNSFRWFLSEIASYGYVVVAAGPIVPDAEGSPRTPAPPPPPATEPPRDPRTLPPPATKTSQLIDAIDWAVAENQRPGSPYLGRLDLKHVALMGQSCGGVQAIEASADPRVATTVIWNSGLFPVPTDMGGGKVMTKDDLKRLHAPIAYISGDSQDVAFLNANDDFDKLQGLPAFRGWERGVPHGGTYRDANGGEFAGVAIGWLNWQLKGDRKAALLFVGPDCGLCANPRWVVRQKNLR